jgi:predicted nucleic acid-binding protein
VIHLDTSFLVRSFVPQTPEEARIRHWLGTRTPLAASAICWAEFLCGPLEQRQIPFWKQILGEPIPFTSSDAERAADLFNSSGRRRGNFVDCMIAATAIREGASLATSNFADFRRFQSFGLQLEK